MRSNTIKCPDLSVLRADADRLLATNGNRLVLIEAIVVLLVTVMPYVMLWSTYEILLQGLFANTEDAVELLLSVGCWILTVLLSLLFTCPLLIGFLRMSWDIEVGGETLLSRLFSSFMSRGTYLRAISLSVGFLWRVALIAGVVAVTCLGTRHFFAGSLLAGVLCGLAVLTELILGICLCLRYFPTLAVAMYEETPLPRAREIARKMMCRCPRAGVWFFLYFIPHILLGLLTFGIFLIWEVMPRMCVTYFLYCRKMNEMMIRSEE